MRFRRRGESDWDVHLYDIYPVASSGVGFSISCITTSLQVVQVDHWAMMMKSVLGGFRIPHLVDLLVFPCSQLLYPALFEYWVSLVEA